MLTSLRERKRYLAFEVLSESPIRDFSTVSKAVWDKALEYLGELGCAEAGIMVLQDKYDAQKQKGLIRVNHTSVDKLKAALALIEQVDNKRAIVRSRGVSGILNKAEGKYIAG